MDNEIKVEDLSSDLQEIANAVGISTVLKISELFGGGPVYFPTKKAITRCARYRAIRSEFNGANYKEIAKKYGLSVVWVRNIVDKKNE